MMDLYQVVDRLTEALKNPLPGRLGQQEMAPLPLDDRRFGQGKGKRQGAVLVLFYSGTDGCRVPFIKRPVYPGVHSAQVSLPGGKWDPSDPDLQATALRETSEEIGVFPEEVTVFGRLSHLYIPPSDFSVYPFLGYTEKPPLFQPDPREVDRLITCSFDHLTQKQTRKTAPIRAGSFTISAPYFDIDNEIVWGATAMILSELLYLWENR
ncbi:hydrolase, NUDIX family protein [Lunatimonas lonarensis]|uniref:Hydrolase, NUDIX family protein n=1 Tax=Lunatimonas lonarensis TaxID=1232681 RepID=R7ZNT5_9BACT|nr:CoA pyrophosphatase [Lunatimonas lonarensis]EON75770.1 hydrolase, NUDIX family protein [Lunatimonas lonarensis]